jgi:predicted nucleotidyltransferase component of viral defense system
MAHLSLHYVGADGRPALLKLDVNFLDRVPVLSPARSSLRHPFGDDLPAIEMRTFAVPELAAAKTIALARRALARRLLAPSRRPSTTRSLAL